MSGTVGFQRSGQMSFDATARGIVAIVELHADTGGYNLQAAFSTGWLAGEAAATAKIFASEGFFQCAAESIQLHGGVGFTWEYDPHLYFKRARASEQILGTPAFHREQLAKQIFGERT